MKRVFASISRVVKSRKFKNLTGVLIIFGLGVVTGSLITNALAKDSKSSPTSSRSSLSVSPEERAKRNTERLEESYNRSKERIEKDVEAKRLTQEQADKIIAKLDEIYKYKKENPDTSSDDSREALQDKRKEWRSWIEQNDVSMRYFIGVL
jgi:hypothetical protein